MRMIPCLTSIWNNVLIEKLRDAEMEIFIILILFHFLLDLTTSLIPDFKTEIINKDGCCNGILGYVDVPTMPCATLKCCNRSEEVAVFRVNHALGFGFRCMGRSLLFKDNLDDDGPQCHRNEIVASSNETSYHYGPKICCHGYRFHIAFNDANTGLVIRCRLR